MEGDSHIVEFEKWCKSCKYEDIDGTDEPCDTCLGYVVRPDSRKPEKWEKKK